MSEMIGNWEDLHQDESTRYFDFADAYLAASLDVCARMQSNTSEDTWPNASVALMLAAHSVELFLKGALISRGSKHSLSHKIDDLFAQYSAVFPENEFKFDCLFVTEYLGYSDDEISKAKELKSPQASVIFRYPVNKPGLEWKGIYGLNSSDFTKKLAVLGQSYTRLRQSIHGL
ncbi:hypothetical protein [Shewanella sp. BC20]|uniref:hypothetical protein n=1 Tax=Shewanella sp. BC20 TaxID=2004459 RepID=UPI0015E80A4C|nr:hypothetical protein [Shewanella sp. BC20]